MATLPRILDAAPWDDPAVGADHDLPVQLTSFVGRVREVAEVHRIVDDARLVTLTGPGGCGKTRLAIQVAGERVATASGAIRFVDLSLVDGDDAVVGAVAAHLGADASSPESLAGWMGDEPALVVLDNCEHVVEPCAALADVLLRGCPEVTIVATSREPLGVAGEVTYRVPSLAADEAAALFGERARRARPSLGDVDGQLVDDVCERLDGIPLAIELAAARMRVFSIAQIRDGLRDRFRLLTGGVRTSVPRQQTLQASVDWSYDLLLEAERTLLRRLSIFAGGFTISAAEAVGADGDIERHHVLDLLSQLVDKSLVTADDGDRFRLLETVRQYAAMRLTDAREAEAAWQRHHAHFVAFARVEPGEDDAAYRDRIRDDYENLRRALQWSADLDDPDRFVQLVINLALYWASTRRTADGAMWAQRAVDRAVNADVRVRGALLRAAAQLTGQSGDWRHGHALAMQSVAVWRKAGDAKGLASALIQAALNGRNAGLPDADVLIDEALEVSSGFGDSRVRAYILHMHGFLVMRDEADIERGIASVTEALAMARRLHATELVRMCEATVLISRYARGEVASVVDDAERLFGEKQRVDEGFMIRDVLMILVMCRSLMGDVAAVDRLLIEVDALSSPAGGGPAVLQGLIPRVVALMARSDWAGVADALRSTRGQILAEPNIDPVGLALRAMVACNAGDLAGAAQLADEAEAIGRPQVLAPPLPHVRALLALAHGDLDLAEDRGQAALAELQRPRPAWTRLNIVHLLAVVASRQGRHDEAVRTFAAADAYARSVGVSIETPMWRSAQHGEVDRLRSTMPAEDFDERWAEGAALSWEELVANLQRGRGARRRATIGWSSLTPTERQVVDLVATGLSNKDVAARLFMSPATVKSHLTHVFSKLDLSTRGQLTAEVLRRGTLDSA